MYLLQDISLQSLTGGGNFSSAPPQPSTSLGHEVCPEVLLTLREISAVTELDRASLDLRRGAWDYI